mmetsp:Transcript_57659/g.113546  ORF Transcript_57659/g.113546 Transcript_57659/m.113546 type:complete len:159 (-) Transcript_57659:998-1474(-)
MHSTISNRGVTADVTDVIDDADDDDDNDGEGSGGGAGECEDEKVCGDGGNGDDEKEEDKRGGTVGFAFDEVDEEASERSSIRSACGPSDSGGGAPNEPNPPPAPPIAAATAATAAASAAPMPLFFLCKGERSRGLPPGQLVCFALAPPPVAAANCWSN